MSSLTAPLQRRYFMQQIRNALFYCFILLAYASYHYLTAVPSTSTHNTEINAHIIFDLGGVLIDTNKAKLLWNLGPTQLTKYWITTGKSPYSLKRTLYTVMNSVERHYTGNAPSYDEEGLLLPLLMHDWLNGKQSNQQILTKLTNAITQHQEWFANHIEQVVMLDFVNILFTPQKFIATRTFIQKGIDLVKWCKKRGFKVYVLSNWDSESFNLLRTQNPNIFNLFDGIIISGQHNCLKPNAELYQILLNTFHVSPSDCIMLDDRIENIMTARSLNIHGIHCTPSGNYDCNAIEKEICAWAKYTQRTLN